jgi:hypothetical protein
MVFENTVLRRDTVIGVWKKGHIEEASERQLFPKFN